MSFHYLRPAVDFNIFCPNSLFMLCLEKGRKKGVGKQHYIIISWRSNVIHVSWFYLFTYLPPSHMTHGGQSCSTVVICIKSCLLKIVPHPFFCSLFALFTSPSVFTSAFGHGSNFDSLEGVVRWNVINSFSAVWLKQEMCARLVVSNAKTLHAVSSCTNYRALFGLFFWCVSGRGGYHARFWQM